MRSCSSQPSRYQASGTMRGFSIRFMASALASSKALYKLIATHGYRSTISCLIPTTCMIGKNAGPAMEGDLLLLVIRKQPPHPLIAGRQRPDQVGREQRVDFTLDQHVLERFIVRHLRDLEARRRREIDVLVELTEPLDRFVRHAVVVLEDAAHPQPGGEQVALGADL